MSKPPPARIFGYFAKAAPVCIIERRGPTKYTQFILWRTDIDKFEPGQWIKGRIDYLTLTADGRYAAVGIMGSKSRVGSWGDTQVAFVCKPPYFTALEVWIGGLCANSVAFLEDDVLAYVGSGQHIVHAQNKCPFTRANPWPFERDHDRVMLYEGEGTDQRGRRVRFSEGKIYVIEPEGPRLLYDTNPNRFENVVAPEWATEW